VNCDWSKRQDLNKYTNVRVVKNGDVSSVAFSPDGTCIFSGGDTARVWDTASGAQVDHILAGNSVSPFLYYDREDKWIYSIKPKRRLCWLPVSCRPVRYSSSGNHVALGTKGGLVVIVDLQGVESYLDAL
jgi:WD40 repeat protein